MKAATRIPGAQRLLPPQLLIFLTLLLTLLTLLTPMKGKAQLQELEPSKLSWTTVGEVKGLSHTKASLKYLVAGADTTYLLTLQDEQKLKNSRDMTVRKYFSIQFSGQDNTCERLYALLSSFFTKENSRNKSYEKTFRLGNEMILVRHHSTLTAAAIVLATTKNHIVLTKKEVDKLFVP